VLTGRPELLAQRGDLDVDGAARDRIVLAVDSADDKHLTAQILADAGVPVPEGLPTEDLGEVLAFWRRLGAPVVTGRFQAMMDVSLVNSGPFTILLDTDKRF